MAQPPKLRCEGDTWKVHGSFSTGRYRFTLRNGAVSLLCNNLDYREGDVLPWELFRILVFTRDAWLPNPIAGPVETGHDLSRPDESVELPERDAKALADHLRNRRVDANVRDALAEEIESTSLSQFISSDELREKGQWVEDMAKLVQSNQTTTFVEEEEKSSTLSAHILHIGRATLGRRNMGRSERIDDYRRAFRHTMDVAIEQDVSAVLQTGGLFQSRSPRNATVAACRDELSRLREQRIPFYHVFGRQEAEAKTDHLTTLSEDGLIEPIGGQSVTLEGGVVLRGVDAGDQTTVTRQSCRDAESGAFIMCAVGGANAAEPGGDPFDIIEENTTVSPHVYLTGGRTDPAWGKRNGTPVVDPGATEHVLSKTTFDEEPVPRGVYEYVIENGSLSVRRHQIPVRSFETLRFDLDAGADLNAVDQYISDVNLSETAVLCLLNGEKHDRSVTREAVQQFLADRSYCARVYDERTVVEPSDRDSEPEGSFFDEVPVADASATYLSVLDEVSDRPLDDLSREELTDLYALCSKVRSVAENIRKASRDRLVEQISADETITGSFGSVSSHRRESIRLKDESAVLEVLDRVDIPREAVYTPQLDKSKVTELLDESDGAIREADLFEYSVSEYITRGDLDTEALEARRHMQNES